MNKPTGPSCFVSDRSINDHKQCDDGGEGHWLREEQPGHCPDLAFRGKFMEMHGDTNRSRGGANTTQKERDVLSRKRLKEMARERRGRRERA